ncbi:hypothetical protein [Candidatus Nitrospira bockiana]
MRKETGSAVSVLLLAVGLYSGCATHGDVVNLREDVYKELAATRAHLNERVDLAADQLEAKKKALQEQTQQALADLKNQMSSLAGLHAKLKELQAQDERQQKALDDLKHQVVTLGAAQAGIKDLQQQAEVSRQAVAELRTRLDAVQKDRARLQQLIQVLEETFLRSLKAEQVELRDRLKALDQSVKDLEHAGLPTAAPTVVTTKP